MSGSSNRRMATPKPGPRLSTDWYGGLTGAVRVPVDVGSPLAAARSAVRLFRRSRSAGCVITTEGSLQPVGLMTLAVLLTVSRQRSLVLLQFLPGRKLGWSGRLVDGVYRLTLRRACAGIQVMTEEEKRTYVAAYRLDPGVVRHIPYYAVDDRMPVEPVPYGQREGILASGRNSCDWSTLLDAAQDQGWPLTIVCSTADRELIEARAVRAGVQVRSELPRMEHNDLLARARLFLVVVKDRGASSGHVRLASAAVRHTPVLASRIPGMAGYEHLTVATVPPEDPAALRRAVNDVLRDPKWLARQTERVAEQAWQRPLSQYAAEIDAFVTECEGRIGVG